MAEREKEADIDPLTPYLARMFGAQFQQIKDPLSMREATLVREQCINDFRARQLARQLLVQERFDKVRYEQIESVTKACTPTVFHRAKYCTHFFS